MELDRSCPSATDGEISAINLESARRRARARFTQDARLPGVVEAVVDKERLAAQFLGDLDALDRPLSACSSRGRFDSASLQRRTLRPSVALAISVSLMPHVR
jgi:hypothetical protein